MSVVVLEIVGAMLLPGLPLAFALASLGTELRGSIWRTVVVLALGAILTGIVLWPLLGGAQIVENGPVHTVTPPAG